MAIFTLISCDAKRSISVYIPNEISSNEVGIHNNGTIEKWVYNDDKVQIILIFYKNSNKGEWQEDDSRVWSMEYSSNEIIMINRFKKYEYIINGNELTIALIRTFFIDEPETYKFKKVMEENVSLFGLWQLDDENGNLLEQLEFDVNNYGTGKFKTYRYASIEGLNKSLIESKINYEIEQKNIFEILYDGLIIFPDYFPEYFQYYKIQGSDMLVIDHPYFIHNRYKKIQ